ncbi:MAG: MFS transporter [Clostridiales bacterium]|nr:MFS transporter [Clostridiales bacterium]
MKISNGAKKAIMIGTLCSVSYLAVYIARNILSAVTPQMTEVGYDKGYIGTISSVYFICYALGQLFNGIVGDRIKAKWMISLGLMLAGISNVLFVFFIDVKMLAPAIYGLTGVFLAMIYGPMTKVVAENTDPIYTTRCSLGYTFASFIGTPAAGLVAIFLDWNGVFFVGSAILAIMGIVSFVVFSSFEKKGLIQYGQYKVKHKEKVGGGVKLLIKNRIILFSLISIITGIVRTSVVFWLPTFISEYHALGSDVASVLFSITTFIIAFTTFISIFVYEKLGHNMDKTMLTMFFSSAVFFILTYFIKQPVIGIITIVLAIMSCNGAATMLYSKYCPSLRDTGMVSTATGFLDCLSYIGAAIANLVFANAVGVIGWQNLILIWLALVIAGFLIVFPYKKLFGKKKKQEEQSLENEKEEI